jgi:hypothetical protein
MTDARHPLLQIAVDIMNDRGRRIFLRSLPFAAFVAIAVILQPHYVGIEKVWGFFLVLVCAVLGLFVVLVVPRAIMVVTRANREKIPLAEFINSRTYQTIREEWREA